MTADERVAFEKWADAEMFDLVRHKDDSETYRNVLTRNAWDAWLARAAQTETPAPLACSKFVARPGGVFCITCERQEHEHSAVKAEGNPNAKA